MSRFCDKEIAILYRASSINKIRKYQKMFFFLSRKRRIQQEHY